MNAPQIISWNLTRRCNLACEHCYLDASPFCDRQGELTTSECLAVVDQIAAASPGALLILSGGEPLLRTDLFRIARYATDQGLATVVGTNGTLLTEAVAEKLAASGVTGVAVSIDSVEARRHDAFRRMSGAWRGGMDAMKALRAQGLPFVVQTTVTADNQGEVPGLAELALNMGARAFNLYFLVPTGRGRYVSNISPQESERLLEVLTELESRYQGNLIVSAKCMPQYQRLLLERGPATLPPRGYQGGGGCPAAINYCAIAPTGDVLPCPYLPVSGGNLRERSLADIWSSSDVFRRLRERGNLVGRCGECEYREACGGCRARAFGTMDDPLAEDPLCLFQPGTSARQPRIGAAAGGGVYGAPVSFSMSWASEAQERLGRVPAVLRGMVVTRVESYARAKGNSEVTAELMAEARNSQAGRRLASPLFVASKVVASKRKALAKRRSPEE